MDFSQFDKGVYVVNVLGIIYDSQTKKILIGRRENDPYIKELTWCFPGGRPAYGEDLEICLGAEIKKKTGFEVEARDIIFAKTYPEDRRFLSVYYLCRIVGGEERAGDKLVELKWIDPKEVTEYFTTSVHAKIVEYLHNIE